LAPDGEGGAARLLLPGGCKVLGRRLAVYARQHQAAQVLPRVLEEGIRAGPIQGRESVPEGLGAAEQGGSVLGQMDGFQGEVIQQECGIESGVAIVRDFKIDGNKGIGGYQKVLGAEVAVDESPAVLAAAFDEPLESGLQSRVAGGGEAVVRVQPQFVEDGLVPESGL
jgi:hypothetical protein